MLTSAKIFLKIKNYVTKINGIKTKFHGYTENKYTANIYHFQQSSLNFRIEQISCNASIKLNLIVFLLLICD